MGKTEVMAPLVARDMTSLMITGNTGAIPKMPMSAKFLKAVYHIAFGLRLPSWNYWMARTLTKPKMAFEATKLYHGEQACA